MEEGFFVELLFDLHAAMPCCFKGQFKQQVPIDCLKSCSEGEYVDEEGNKD